MPNPSNRIKLRLEAVRWVPVLAMLFIPMLLIGFQNCGKVGVSGLEKLESFVSPEPFCNPATSPDPCQRDNGTGFRECTYDGTAWGECKLNACNGGYQLFRNECDFTGCTPGQEAPCSGTNGFGTYFCNAGGTGFGVCGLTSCRSGYYLHTPPAPSPKACNPWVCTPAPSPQSRTCSIANGTGLEYCNSAGSNWTGSCVRTGCNQWYHPDAGNGCAPDFVCIDLKTITRIAKNVVGVASVRSSTAYCNFDGEQHTIYCYYSRATCSENGWTNMQSEVQYHSDLFTCSGSDYNMTNPSCPTPP